MNSSAKYLLCGFQKAFVAHDPIVGAHLSLRAYGLGDVCKHAWHAPWRNITFANDPLHLENGIRPETIVLIPVPVVATLGRSVFSRRSPGVNHATLSNYSKIKSVAQVQYGDVNAKLVIPQDASFASYPRYPRPSTWKNKTFVACTRYSSNRSNNQEQAPCSMHLHWMVTNVHYEQLWVMSLIYSYIREINMDTCPTKGH